MDGIKSSLTNLLKSLRLLPRRRGSAFARFHQQCLLSCNQLGITNPAQIAYIFATIEHETNGTFKSVREGYWLTEKVLIAWLMRNNKSYVWGKWWGRGHIQTTWSKNYYKIDEHFQLDGKLINNPDLLLNDFELSVASAVAGMKFGWFTGKKLDDYINENSLDMRGARRIVNGNDRATKIAKLSYKYLDLLPLLNNKTKEAYDYV